MQCISSGGRALNMSVTGSGGFKSVLSNISEVDMAQGLGNDSFVGTTDIISERSDGHLYQCTARNGVSTIMDSVELRGYIHIIYII